MKGSDWSILKLILKTFERNKSLEDNEELNKYKTLAELEQTQTDRLRNGSKDLLRQTLLVVLTRTCLYP